jgi:sugar lactone lactonase YvrE
LFDRKIIFVFFFLVYGFWGSAKAVYLKTISGNNSSGYQDGLQAISKYNSPLSIIEDSKGNLFVVDSGSKLIRKISLTGEVSTFAGSFSQLKAITRDSEDNLFVLDSHCVKKITIDGLISTIAGDCSSSGYQDGNFLEAKFNSPSDLLFESNGDLLIIDSKNNKIRKLDFSNMIVSTFAGNGSGYLDGPINQALFNSPQNIAINSSGEIFLTEFLRIRKLSFDGANWNISTIAGTSSGMGGDEVGVGSASRFYNLTGIAINQEDEIFVSDSSNHKIKKITFDGTDWQVSNFAGLSGQAGALDGTPEKASLNYPSDLYFDSNNNLLIADTNNHLIRKLIFDEQTDEPEVSSLFGRLGYSTKLGPLSVASIYTPGDMVLDSVSNIYISELDRNRILKISENGSLSVFAGSSLAGYIDGEPSASQFQSIKGLAIDSFDNIFVADKNNHCIRKISPSGFTSTYAGSCGIAGFQDGLATEALFNQPFDIAIDSTGNLFVTDYNNHRVRMIDTSLRVSTVSGSESYGFIDGNQSNSKLRNPHSIVINTKNEIFITEINSHTIRKIFQDPLGNWITETYAGIGNNGSGFRDANRLESLFQNPHSLVIDLNDNIFVSDSRNNRIRVISGEKVFTLAGSGIQGFRDGSLDESSFSEPGFMTFDHLGNLLISDLKNQRVRKISKEAIDKFFLKLSDSSEETSTQSKLQVKTISGFSSGAYGFRNGLIPQALFRTALGMIFDSDENLLIADSFNHCIRKIDFKEGIVSTLAGGLSAGDLDGYLYESRFNAPSDIVIDSEANVFVADTRNNKIKKISKDGEVSTFAGNGLRGLQDGRGLNASFWNPEGLGIDSEDNIYVADSYNNAIRKIDKTGQVSTLIDHNTKTQDPISGQPISRPKDIVVDSNKNLYISSNSQGKIYKIDLTKAESSIYAGLLGIGYKDGKVLEAQFNSPSYMTIDKEDNIYLSDRNNRRIRKINNDGSVITIAGTGLPLIYDGDIEEAAFFQPSGIAMNSDGLIYVSDYRSAIREISEIAEPAVKIVEKPVFIEPFNRGPFISLMSELNSNENGQLLIDKNKLSQIRVFVYDSEEGFSIAKNIFWISSTKGSLGSGINLDTSKLDLGDHEIRVEVSDSQGLSSSIFLKLLVYESDLSTNDDKTLNPNSIGTASMKLFLPKRLIYPKGKVLQAKALAINILDKDATEIEDISDQIVWGSDLNGEIGTGRKLRINTKKLKKGTHNISAVVNGISRSFEVEIKSKKRTNQ